MGIVTGLFLLICGFLGITEWFVQRKPDAQKLADALAPYQGWIGFVGAFWGFWWIINSLLNLRMLGMGFKWLLWWITILGSGVCLFGLGVILGFNLLNQYVFSKNPKMEEKGAQLKEKLVTFQTPLSWGALGLGLWSIVYSFML